MPERDGYIPGVPCWVDTSQPDPEAAAAFYRGLFGWELEDVMPPGSEGKYFMARIRGGDVAAIGSPPPGAPLTPTWSTYVWVQSADETAERVWAGGGACLTEPFDVSDAGRTAVFADPEGAVFSVWQPGQHRGARIVNEHGTLNFNTLYTQDVGRAAEFYGQVFGWRTMPMGPGRAACTLPGYGDHLMLDRPTLREDMAAVGAPPGFEDVVAAVEQISSDRPDGEPRWGVTFAVDDADATAAKAVELGGSVLSAPHDEPWVRTTVLTDPQGAVLTASQFVLENKDLPAPSREPARAA